MAAPGTLERTDDGQTRGGHGWIVTVYDNDKNTMEQVIEVLMDATGCDLDEAEMETWEVHFLGRSTVHHGGREECGRAAEVIRRIGIRVTVTEE